MLNRIPSSPLPRKQAASDGREILARHSNANRPAAMAEFVGQDHLKALIRTCVVSAKKRNAPFPHALLTGLAGMGKTTLAALIAAEMGVNFVPTTAEAFEDSAAVKGLIQKLDDSGHDRDGQASGAIHPTVLFLDEAHRLPRKSQELLYSCVEDRFLDTQERDFLTGAIKPVRQWVPHFTLVAATNRPGELTTAFRDRLRLHLRLEAYTEKDASKIARGALERMEIACGPKSAAMIAARGRGVPRRIIAICEQVRDVALSRGKATASPRLCAKAFAAMSLDPIGLNRGDLELLRHLGLSDGRPVGLQTLAAILGEDERTIEESVEPFLLSRGLVARTPKGRTITPAGIQYLRLHHGFEATGEKLP